MALGYAGDLDLGLRLQTRATVKDDRVGVLESLAQGRDHTLKIVYAVSMESAVVATAGAGADEDADVITRSQNSKLIESILRSRHGNRSSLYKLVPVR